MLSACKYIMTPTALLYRFGFFPRYHRKKICKPYGGCFGIFGIEPHNVAHIIKHIYGVGDFPKEHNLVIFLIRFKPHCPGECGIFRIVLEILTSKLERIHEQFIFPYAILYVILIKGITEFYMFESRWQK